MRRKLAAVLAGALLCGGVLVSTPATEADAAAQKFTNCTKMHAKYKGGVAKNSRVRNMKRVNGKWVAAKSKYKPKVSASIYARNKNLDRDKDGIACER